MNEDQAKREVYLGVDQIESVFGTADALDNTDAITAALIIEYIRSVPAVGKNARVALVAIAFLAETDADRARQLIAELNVQ